MKLDWLRRNSKSNNPVRLHDDDTLQEASALADLANEREELTVDGRSSPSEASQRHVPKSKILFGSLRSGGGTRDAEKQRAKALKKGSLLNGVDVLDQSSSHPLEAIDDDSSATITKGDWSGSSSGMSNKKHQQYRNGDGVVIVEEVTAVKGGGFMSMTPPRFGVSKKENNHNNENESFRQGEISKTAAATRQTELDPISDTLPMTRPAHEADDAFGVQGSSSSSSSSEEQQGNLNANKTKGRMPMLSRLGFKSRGINGNNMTDNLLIE